MDSAVIPLSKHKNLSLVQTVDFFYPLVDHPNIMGKIALANVLSDIYAVGVVQIDRLSLIISSPTEFTDTERDIIIPMIIDGFQESALAANCKVSVRNIAVNPWCMLGGIATAVCRNDEIIIPNKAEPGDLIVLTKPLGTQLATNSYVWMHEKNDKYEKISSIFTEQQIENTYLNAIKSMTFLNKIGAELMQKYNAHCATDVTGFGLLGHATNLAKFQLLNVTLLIERLPIIQNVRKIGEIIGQDRKLLNGEAVETSGGLLICLPAANAQLFCNEFKQLNDEGQQAWIIGNVIENNDSNESNAKLSSNLEYLDIDFSIN